MQAACAKEGRHDEFWSLFSAQLTAQRSKHHGLLGRDFSTVCEALFDRIA